MSTAPARILVGSFKNEITTIEFDPLKKSLTAIHASKSGEAPSWLQPHPSRKNIFFAVNEVDEGMLQVFQLQDDRQTLKLVSETSTKGSAPTHIAVSESDVFVSNYMSGSIFIVPLSSGCDEIIEPAKSALIQFEGKGPNAERQECAHAHHTLLHPSGKEAWVCDLGSDKIWTLQKDNDGKWSISGSLDIPEGHGPRHTVWHDGFLYTALELQNKLVVHDLNHLPHTPPLISKLQTRRTEPEEGMTLAEIVLSDPSESHPQRLIYVSNRDEPGPKGDSIAVYTPHILQPPAETVLVNSVSTGLKHLRSFSLGGWDQSYLIAGGVKNDLVKVYKRESDGLEEIASLSVESPSCFVWI